MIVQYDNLKTQLIAEDENKQAGNKETQNLRLKLAELESSKMNLEKELANFKLNSEQDQNASRQRISILNQTIEVNIVLRNLNYIIWIDRQIKNLHIGGKFKYSYCIFIGYKRSWKKTGGSTS